MSQIAKSIRKLGFQFQSHLIRSYRIWNIPRVFVNRCQVAVCISKGWVDLNGPSVALQSSLHILHLFESVAHVGVGIGKIGVDSGGMQVTVARACQ